MGEPIKSLQKMANNTHGVVRIEEGDLVYITTTPTTAMETTVAQNRGYCLSGRCYGEANFRQFTCVWLTLIRMTCN